MNGTRSGNVRPPRTHSHNPLGIGGRQNSSITGTTTVCQVGKQGKVYYLTEDDLRTNQQGALSGAFFQAAYGTVKVAFTLLNSERACDPNPDVQAQIAWSNEIDVAQEIVEAPVPFTAIRITFTSNSEFYAYGR